MSKPKPSRKPFPHDPQPDPARQETRAEWRLRMLAELAEIDMKVARALARRALAKMEPAPPRAITATDPAFDGISPTVH